MTSYIPLIYSISGRLQWLGAGGWHQDMFIFCAEDGWWDLLFQTSQIFLRSFDVPTNDLFLFVARGRLFPTRSRTAVSGTRFSGLRAKSHKIQHKRTQQAAFICYRPVFKMAVTAVPTASASRKQGISVVSPERVGP